MEIHEPAADYIPPKKKSHRVHAVSVVEDNGYHAISSHAALAELLRTLDDEVSVYLNICIYVFVLSSSSFR